MRFVGKSIPKTRKHLHAHARRRAGERYGLSFTKDVHARFVALIKAGKTALVSSQTHTRKIHDLEYEGRVYRVVYNTNLGAIATFLPREETPNGAGANRT